MIDYARPTYESYELYHPAPAPPARLDDFQVFKKSTPFMYAHYYTNPANDYGEAEIGNATQVYQNLVNSTREYHNDWRIKYVFQWTEDDSMSWLMDTVQQMGFSELDVPVYNFRVSGIELREMKREQVAERMAHVNLDPALTRRIADTVFQRLEARLQDEEYRHSTVLRYVDAEYPPHEPHSVLDLDAFDKDRQYTPEYKPADAGVLQAACDSSDDADDIFRHSANASPDCDGSDFSKSGDEDDKRKIFKRPPGRPKGTGRKVCKRPKSVSVPEFLRNLLLDPEYCPSIIKWEDRSVGKFRFVKPDEVAKLWGKMKQNDNMTFEKFSRAMRYHYRQSVLVSVPSARLVYQFGHKGPTF